MYMNMIQCTFNISQLKISRNWIYGGYMMLDTIFFLNLFNKFVIHEMAFSAGKNRLWED